MKLHIQVAFAWAHRGVDVKRYDAGSEVDTDDEDLVRVALAEGWAVDAAQPSPTAPLRAPEDKDASRVRRQKKGPEHA
jgi:hypothetical protein